MFVLILLILILMILHLLCLRGRKNQPGMETLRGWYYAHRGLHDDEKPENSLPPTRLLWTRAMALNSMSIC